MAERDAAKDDLASLSPEDVEVALRMLAEEQRQKKTSWLSLVAYALYAATGIGALAGIPLIFLKPRLGEILTGAAIASYLFSLLLKRIKPEMFEWQEPDSRTTSKQGRAMSRRAGDLWDREFGSASNTVTIAGRTVRLTMLAGFLLLFAIAWLIYALVSANSVLPPIALVCGVALVLGLPQAYAKQRYETAVGRLYQSLDAQRSATVVLETPLPHAAPDTFTAPDYPPLPEPTPLGEPEPSAQLPSTIPSSAAAPIARLSAEDYSLLSQIEEKQTIQSVVQSLPSKLAAARNDYAVALDASAIAFLTELRRSDSDAAFAIRELVDSLQADHDPSTAKPVSGSSEQFVIESSERFQITYRVDNARQRVEVLSIARLTAGAIADG